jgi:hypothetical protein
MEWKMDGAPTVLGIVSGVVAGLVAITPACGFVSALSAIPIGLIAGIAAISPSHGSNLFWGTTIPRCLRRPRDRRHLGNARHRALRRDGDQPGGSGRIAPRKCEAVSDSDLLYDCLHRYA